MQISGRLKHPIFQGKKKKVVKSGQKLGESSEIEWMATTQANQVSILCIRIQPWFPQLTHIIQQSNVLDKFFKLGSKCSQEVFTLRKENQKIQKPLLLTPWHYKFEGIMSRTL